MEKDIFFKNSFFLTAANITTGILGFIFSMYLNNLAGPEGVALYGLVMPVYNLFICLMTAGAEIKSWLAALLKLWLSATAINVFSWSSI